jgi:hypothetical protein
VSTRLAREEGLPIFHDTSDLVLWMAKRIEHRAKLLRARAEQMAPESTSSRVAGLWGVEAIAPPGADQGPSNASPSDRHKETKS